MKTKKVLFAVLTAMLVIALIISCAELLDNQNIGSNDKEEQVAPPGKSLVRINLVNSNGRTIMPNHSAYADLDDFDYLTLNITQGGAAVPLDTPFDDKFIYDSGDTFTNNPILLDTGKQYVFTLIAYSASDVALALGTATQTISAAGNVSIVLKEIKDGAGTGILVVDPVITDGATATLSLTGISANTTSGIAGVNSFPYTNPAIKSGYYLMTISLSKNEYESIDVVEVVYIWQGFTTTYDAQVPVLRPNVYTIQYYYPGDPNSGTGTANNGADGFATEKVGHGNLLQMAIGTANGTDGSKVLAGWFTAANGGGVEIYNKDATTPTIILKPYTLYAKWADAKLAMTGAPTLAWTTAVVPELTTAIQAISQGQNNISITVTVDNDEAFNTFTWYVNGTEVTNNAQYSGQGTKTLAITGNVSTLTTWYQIGNHTITLLVTDISGSWTRTWNVAVSQ